MKNLHLSLGLITGQILSREELKNVLGGAGGDGGGCAGSTEKECVIGSCTLSNGNPGNCGWTAATSSCRCT